MEKNIEEIQVGTDIIVPGTNCDIDKLIMLLKVKQEHGAQEVDFSFDDSTMEITCFKLEEESDEKFAKRQAEDARRKANFKELEESGERKLYERLKKKFESH